LGGGDFEKMFLQGYSERQQNTCTGGGGKYPALVFGGEKMLQNSMVAGINSTSPRSSAGLIFRD
jgi:hypothetical protein